MQNPNQTPAKSKRKPLQPIPCLAAIGKPASNNPLCFTFEAIGYFPSRKKARAKVDAIRAENPLYNLRAQGHNIADEWRVTENGKRYKVYFLVG